MAIINGYATLSEVKQAMDIANTYTATTISFAVTSNILTDVAYGLRRFQDADIVKISGTDSNDGYYTIVAATGNTAKTFTTTEALATEAAGDSVTIEVMQDQKDDATIERAINAASRYIDDITGTRFFTLAENELQNPGFEEGITLGWTTQDLGAGAVFTEDFTTVFEGKSSAKIVAGNAIALINSDTFVLQNGDTVYAQSMAYTDTILKTNLAIRNVTEATTEANDTGAAANAWEQLATSWTNDSGWPVSISVRMSNLAADSAGIAYFDDVQVRIYHNDVLVTGNETRYYTAEESREMLMRDDLLSIATLKTDDDGDGTFENTWATTDYNLGPYNAAIHNAPYTWIERTVEGNYSFPSVRRGVEIVGKFAFSRTAPPEVNEACVFLAQRYLKRKDAPLGIAGNPTVGFVQLQHALDPDVEALLGRWLTRKSYG